MGTLLGSIKEVFSNENVMVVSVSNCIGRFTQFLWQAFFSLYLMNELGATIEAVGIVSLVQNTALLLYHFPAGMLADKIGRKKIIMLGCASQVIPSILFLSATTWVQVIPAFILFPAPWWIQANNALIAESLPSKQRGIGFGVSTVVSFLPAQVFPPVISGWVTDTIGLAKGTRVFLICFLIAHMITLLFQARFITETLGVERRGKFLSLRGHLSQFTKLPKTLYAMLAVSCFSGIVMRMIMPFLAVYGVDVIGLSKTQWGLIMMVEGLISCGLSLPGGILADKIGRKPLILLSRVIAPTGRLGLAFSHTFTQALVAQLIYGLGGTLGGPTGGMGAPAWQALMADLTPASKRASVMGLIGTISGLIGAPFSVVGGYLWNNYYPALPLQMSFPLEIIPTLILYLLGKEPEVKEK